MDKDIQDMLNDLPNKKFSKLSDKQLEGYEIQKNIPRNEQWRNKIGKAHKGKIVSESTLKKMSEVNKGKKHSDKTKEICRQKSIGLNVGRKHSQEVKDKLSKLKTGTKLSEETKRKMSEKRKGKPISSLTRQKSKEATSKPILYYTYPDMKFICEFESISEASRKLNRDKGGIGKILNGTIKNPRNYTFRYKE